MGNDVRINSKIKKSATQDYFKTEHLRVGLRNHALKGASITIVAQFAGFVIQTIGSILLARLLTPDDFGIVTMVLTISLLLGNFGVNGFTEAIIQNSEINHKQISTLFWINVLISILLALLFIAFSPVIVWFYKEPRLTPIIIAIAGSNVIAGLSVQHLALLKRSMQFNKSSLNDFLGATISSVIPIALALWGWGYWALVAKWVLAPTAVTIGAWLMCDWHPGLPARDSGVKPMLKYALHTYGNFIMSYFRRNIDKILIGRSFGSQPLGYYDRAYHLSNMLPVQIITPLYSVAVSSFSKLSSSPDKFRQSYLKVLSILAFVGMPLSAVLTLISYDVIFLLLGPQWYKAGQIFLIFGLSIGISIIYVTHGWLHLSLGTPDRWFRWSIIEFAVTALCFILALPFGASGIACAFSASFYILIGPALWYAGKPINLKFRSVLTTLWNYYASALASGLFCWFIFYVQGSTSTVFNRFNTPGRIVVSALLCIIIYLIILTASFQSLHPIKQFLAIVGEIIHEWSAKKKNAALGHAEESP
jgi:O-antigen/teichoic acid export membrane protein